MRWPLLVLASALLGCPSREASHRAGPEAGELRVAMILPGARDDGAWSQAGYEGLELIERELGARIAFSENVGAGDAERVLRSYARDGNDFIIGHGGEYIHAAEVVAAEFPTTSFAVVAAYPGNNRNLGALSYREGEVGYLCGVVAALKTRSQRVAFVSGVLYPHTLEQAVSFERGVKAIHPGIVVTIDWVGSWTDAERTRALVRTRLAQGADVVLVSVDKASVAGFEEVKAHGAWAIGWSVDQHAVAPETIVTSAIQRAQVLLLEGARLVRQGRWEGKQYKFGLREGAQDLAPFYGLLTPEDVAVVGRIRDDIEAGRIDVTAARTDR